MWDKTTHRITQYRQNFATIRLALKLPYSIHGFHQEISMIKTRSLALSMIWILAFAFYSGCQEDRVNNIPAGANMKFMM